MADKTAPPSQLRLEWVYGYRGNQCRNNLYYNVSREAVYFVAGVGIVHNVAAKKQKFFRGQSDDILCLALHPNKELVATGQIGKDPFICVWNSQTMETVSILQGGHERGIATVAFSTDGEKIVSTGLEDQHWLTVWDWKKGKVIASTRGHGDKIFDTQFNPYDPTQVVTCGVKHIKFWTLCGNSLSGKKGIFGKKGELQTILCLGFASDHTVFSGTLSGDIYQWKGHSLINVIKSAHNGAIHSIHCGTDGFATGGKDGKLSLWNDDFTPVTSIDLTRTSKGYKGLCIRSVCWEGENILIGTKDGEVFQITVQDRDNPLALVQGHAEGELWGLASHPTQPIFATGSDDKTIRIWSIPDRSVLLHCSTPHPVRSVAFSTGDHLAAGMQNGSFIVFSTKDLSALVEKKDRKEVLHEMKYSPDGQFLAVGSNDNFVDIYSVTEGYKRVGVCKGSSSFITHLDWSEDSQYLVTNSGASEKLYYKAPDGTHIVKTEEIESIKWSSWTGVLGTHVLGIWPKYSQVNDVNATDTSFDHKVIVTGDDFGLVKIFRFPSVKKGAKFRKYTGHSAHVTNVRFTSDKKRVISTGGADHGVFQWRFLPDGVEGEDEDGESVLTGAFMDTDSEASDSDVSDVDSLDSDLEKEQEMNYDRVIYREDLVKLKEQAQIKQQQEDDEETSGKKVPKRRRGVKSSSSHGKKDEPPKNSLSLDFVYGYRGYDCRANLYYTKTNEIVYHIAALGIVYNKHEHKQRYYSAHDDDILCLALHPTQDYVATGQIGRDPTIHVWDCVTMETISILQGQHYRGVCAVDFSGDGKKLASVGLDDDHSIVVWNWKKGEKLATTRGHKDKIFMIRWNPFDENQLATVGIKHIKFWNQVGGGFTSKRGIFGKLGKPITMLCVAYGSDVNTAYSGGADGKVYQWNKTTVVNVIEYHRGPIFVIQLAEKGYLTGGKDGIISLWDESFQNSIKNYDVEQSSLIDGGQLYVDYPPIRSLALGQDSILVGTKNSEILEVQKSGEISVLIQGHMEGELWGLAVHPNRQLIVTASDDGTVRLWNLNSHSLHALINIGRPVRCAAFSHDGKVIAVGLKDGTFFVINAETFEKIVSYSHRKEELSDVRFSPNGKYLAVASHDNFVDIYNVLNQKRVGICKGASSYITHIDWDEMGKLIQLNTGDREVLYFEAPRGKQQLISKEDASEITWDTWTCVLGDSCRGIWPPYTDVTDVNAANVSRDGDVIATGDDFGFVKLFKYPSPGKNAKCKQYVGHSAHVTNVRFTYDGSKLVSTGGADLSIMVWSNEGNQGISSLEEDEGTDSEAEEEGGYDSDVERERTIDYVSKTYVNPIREATLGPKPTPDKPLPDTKRNVVSRNVTTVPKVAVRDEEDQVEVKNLTLDFIFGYRGFDTRQNIFYTPNGEIIFHAAGAGIVYDRHTKKQSFYLEHNDDIICLALNPSPKALNVVATGQIGKNAPIHLWDIQTKQTLSILQGAHSVGVCSVDFNHNGKLLVSVGLDSKNSITVWRWAEGTKMAQATGSINRIFLAQFRPDSTNKFVSVGVRHVKFWSLAGSKLLSKRGALNLSTKTDYKMQTMLSIAFAPNDITYTGSISGDVFMWKGHVLTRVIEKAHSGPVFAMFSSVNENKVLSGGKERGVDSVIKSWDIGMQNADEHKLLPFPKATIRSVSKGENGKILIGTQSSEIVEIDPETSQAQVIIHAHAEGELWGMAVHPQSHDFVTASCDKTICSWSLSDKVLLNERKVEQEAASADISPSGELVAVGLHNGEFLLLSFVDFNIVAQKRDRSKTLQVVRFSPDGHLLAVGSDDACVDIYDISTLEKGPNRVGSCKGIPSYVTHIDWSTDSKYLQVCSGYYEKLIFEVESGKLLTDAEDITWASWTSILGEEMKGIWPRNADKADVNTAHVNNSGTAVATGDDYGCVKLFDHFPVSEPYAPHKKFFGHSAHVTNVKFTYDDQYLLSAGGDDSCVFVWKCQK